MENTIVYDDNYAKGEVERINHIRLEIDRQGSIYKHTTLRDFDKSVKAVARLKYWYKKVREKQPGIDVKNLYSYYILTEAVKNLDIVNGKFYNAVKDASSYYILSDADKRELDSLIENDINNLHSKLVAKKIRKFEKEAKADKSKARSLRILNLLLSIGCGALNIFCLFGIFSKSYEFKQAFLFEANTEAEIVQMYKEEKIAELEKELASEEISQSQYDLEYQNVLAYDFDYIYNNPDTINSNNTRLLYESYLANEEEMVENVIYNGLYLFGFFASVFGTSLTRSMSKGYAAEVYDIEKRNAMNEETVEDFLNDRTLQLNKNATY